MGPTWGGICVAMIWGFYWPAGQFAGMPKQNTFRWARFLATMPEAETSIAPAAAPLNSANAPSVSADASILQVGHNFKRYIKLFIPMFA